MTNKSFIFFIFLTSLGSVCRTPKDSQTISSIVYYKKFNIFNLVGEDTLYRISPDNREYVEVKYLNRTPSRIKYHFPSRKVELKLSDSFILNGRNIYTYSVDNLLGGKAGKQREYSLRRIRNMYILFVNFSDTLIVIDFDAIDAENEFYNYQIRAYIRKNHNDVISMYLESENSKNITGIDRVDLYSYWYEKGLHNIPKDAVIRYKKFPPE